MENNKFKFSNFFRKHKAVVLYDVSEKPDGLAIGEIIEIYDKTGFILVDNFGNAKKELNTHVIKL